jgi:hypothetical protein
MDRDEDQTSSTRSRVGEQVGLGRVIEDRRPATPDGTVEETPDGTVEDASEQSFPASDAPARGGDAITRTPHG